MTTVWALVILFNIGGNASMSVVVSNIPSLEACEQHRQYFMEGAYRALGRCVETVR